MGPMYFMVFFLLGIFHSSLAKACLGCPQIADAKDPAAIQYLSNKLKHVAPKGLELEEEAQLVRIKEFKKQVVEGMVYTYNFEVRGLKSNSLYDCKLVVTLQEWKGLEKINEYNCQVVSLKKQKRSIPGGEFIIDIENNSDLQELESAIGEEVGKNLKSKYLMKVVRFFKATKQIVEGSLYKTTVEVANTNCLENSQSKDENCQIQHQDSQVCDVQVWFRPWLNKKEVTEVNCRPQPKFCAGCPFKANPEDVTAQQCLKRVLSNINALSHPSKQLSLTKINKATYQVVAGLKYTFEFDAESENEKSSYTCKAVVFSQPWISEEPTISEFTCAPRSKY